MLCNELFLLLLQVLMLSFAFFLVPSYNPFGPSNENHSALSTTNAAVRGKHLLFIITSLLLDYPKTVDRFRPATELGRHACSFLCLLHSYRFFYFESLEDYLRNILLVNYTLLVNYLLHITINNFINSNSRM